MFIVEIVKGSWTSKIELARLVVLLPDVHLAVLKSLVDPVFNKELKFGRRVDTLNGLNWPGPPSI